jgi:hypothetical protein
MLRFKRGIRCAVTSRISENRLYWIARRLVANPATFE